MTDILDKPLRFTDTTGAFGAPAALQPKPMTKTVAGSTPVAGVAPMNTTATPTAGQDTTGGYGSAGNLTNVPAGFDPSKLPSWLASQFFQTQGSGTTGGDAGTSTGPQWGYQYNLKDQNGNPVVQIGANYQVAGQGGNGGGVIDPSKVTYDPVLGYVTSPDNIKTVHDSGAWNLVGPAAALLPLGLGLAGAAGLLPDFLTGSSTAAGTGALDTSLLPSITAPTLPGDVTLPANLAADTITPGINQAIDTSLLPNITAPTIPELPALPDITTPTIPGLDTPFDVNLQPAPTPPEITPPDVNITGAGPTGITSIDNAIGKLTSDPLRLAGLGLTAATALGNHPSGIPSGLTNQVNANTPLATQANTTLQNNGAPTQDQMAYITNTINQQRQQGTEAIIQASINAGQGGKDSMVVQDKIRAFNDQLTVMQEGMVQQQSQQNILNAMSELGLVNQEQFQLAQLEIQQDNAAQQRAMQIMSSLGWLWSAGSKSTTGGP